MEKKETITLTSEGLRETVDVIFIDDFDEFMDKRKEFREERYDIEELDYCLVNFEAAQGKHLADVYVLRSLMFEDILTLFVPFVVTLVFSVPRENFEIATKCYLDSIRDFSMRMWSFKTKGEDNEEG